MELNGRYPGGPFTTARNLTGMEDPQQLTEYSVLPRGIASLTPDSSRFSRCGSSSLCFCIRKEMSVAFHAGIKKNPSEFLQLTTILMQRRHPLLQVWQKWHPQKATLYALGYKKLPCSFSCTKRRPPPYWRRQVWQLKRNGRTISFVNRDQRSSYDCCHILGAFFGFSGGILTFGHAYGSPNM